MSQESQSVPHPARWGVLYRSSGPLWDAAKEHELRIQRCAQCHHWLMPPRPMCPQCQSMESEYTAVSGRGAIHSWVTYSESPHPAFGSPHTVVLVDLEEGPRVVSNVVDVAAEDLEIGMPVQVVFEDVDDDLTLYKFERAA